MRCSMTDREQLVADLETIATWFRQRIDGASQSSQNRYWHFAEIAHRASESIYSDGETIKEYEEYCDRMEDDGK